MKYTKEDVLLFCRCWVRAQLPYSIQKTSTELHEAYKKAAVDMRCEFPDFPENEERISKRAFCARLDGYDFLEMERVRMTQVTNDRVMRYVVKKYSKKKPKKISIFDFFK